MIKKRPKYGNKKVIIDGILFDSKKEGMRWLILKDALANGTITDLERQVKVELIPQIKEEYDRLFAPSVEYIAGDFFENEYIRTEYVIVE